MLDRFVLRETKINQVFCTAIFIYSPNTNLFARAQNLHVGFAEKKETSTLASMETGIQKKRIWGSEKKSSPRLCAPFQTGWNERGQSSELQ